MEAMDTGSTTVSHNLFVGLKVNLTGLRLFGGTCPTDGETDKQWSKGAGKCSGNWKRMELLEVLLMWKVILASLPKATSPKLSSSGAGGK
jgi:hypothetical protein